jgi:hypothetical protein
MGHAPKKRWLGEVYSCLLSTRAEPARRADAGKDPCCRLGHGGEATATGPPVGDKITPQDRQREIRLNDGAGERVSPRGGADVAVMGGRRIIPQLSFGLGVSGIWRGPPSADP